ncbi:MAG: rod shape-determining protein MreC [Planctomycetota bacterium]|nr:rod shape-determining protein MreC [Planctomycetota bacterium]
MSRSPSQPLHHPRLLLAAVLVLVLLAVVPGRWTAWAGWFGRPVAVLAAPPATLFRLLGSWLAPPKPPALRNDERALLEEHRKAAETQYLQLLEENDRLKAQIKVLQRGLELNPDLPVKQLTARVVATASDLASGLLRIRAGESQGVTAGSVVTADGLQLVGRVDSVAGPLAFVRPITHKASPEVTVRVMTGDFFQGTGAESLIALLKPQGDGSLKGEVGTDAGAALGGASAPRLEPKPGQTVRLADRTWPGAAQMLIVGTVTRVDPSPTQPLRKVITVEPTLRLDRVSEVVLRLTDESMPIIPAAPTGGAR